MSESRIDVIFGARIGEQIAGVAEAKEAIEVRAPIDSFIVDQVVASTRWV